MRYHYEKPGIYSSLYGSVHRCETCFDRKLIWFAKLTAPIMEGVDSMILFIILLSILLAISMISAICLIIGAGSVILVFGDVIVFVLILWIIVKLFTLKKKE